MMRMFLIFGSMVLTVAGSFSGSFAQGRDSAGSVTFFVAPAGHDAWSGRFADPGADGSDGPFATLPAACRAARESGTRQPRTIVVQAGEYFLDEPVVLTAKDSGLTIKAAPDAEVRLYGGTLLTGWEKDGDRFYAARLPGVRERKWDFRALIINERFCPRARLPEEGYFEHLSRFDVPWMTTTGGGWKRKPTEKELTTLKYNPQDLGPWLDVNNVEVTVYHMWDESLVGLSAMDTESHSLTFSNPAGHPPGAFGVKKYVAWNVREGLTQPGQWYLDRTRGKVVYWPLPGEDMAMAKAIAPTVESIITLKGTKDDLVRDITVRGLTLSVTTTPLEAGGFGAGKFEGAVSASFAESCRFVDLEIVNVGGQGIKVAGSEVSVERCHVHHAGACGIRFHGTATSVTDNHIHDIGLTYPSAIALSGGGQGGRISHNHIHHTPYSAVTCGGENHRIEHNRIHHAMQELHDGAGIYCFAGKGLILRGNFIHDIVDTGGYGASAYYLDERSQDCLVAGNLSIDVARPSHNHMAKSNTLRNNVFISHGDLRLTFPRSSGYTFEKNILHAEGKIVFDNFEAISTAADNVFFSLGGTVERHQLDRYSRTGSYAMKSDGSNLQADPMLAAYRQGKVEFTSGSPALGLGIKPIDVSGAGPRP